MAPWAGPQQNLRRPWCRFQRQLAVAVGRALVPPEPPAAGASRTPSCCGAVARWDHRRRVLRWAHRDERRRSETGMERAAADGDRRSRARTATAERVTGNQMDTPKTGARAKYRNSRPSRGSASSTSCDGFETKSLPEKKYFWVIVLNKRHVDLFSLCLCLTCVSVRLRESAKFSLSQTDRYLVVLNLFSRATNCS